MTNLFFCRMKVGFFLLLVSVASSLSLPFWSSLQPNASKPLGGYAKLRSSVSRVFLASVGFEYNHNAQIDYALDTFVVTWKNGIENEDENGQKMLISFSIDGKTWSAAQVVFPNLTTPEQKAVMEPSPLIRVNGRLYAAGSPGVFNRTHDASAQGSQVCYWLHAATLVFCCC